MQLREIEIVFNGARQGQIFQIPNGDYYILSSLRDHIAMRLLFLHIFAAIRSQILNVSHVAFRWTQNIDFMYIYRNFMHFPFMVSWWYCGAIDQVNDIAVPAT